MTECVRTIEDLRSLSPKNISCVLVQGYSSPGDEGGGLFFWDSHFPNAEDFGTVIKSKVSSPEGSWRRMIHDQISVKWFGAKGDMQEYYEDTDPSKTSRHFKGTANGISIIIDKNAISNLDIGKSIILWKDDIKDLPFVTTIIGYDVVTNTITLKDAAPVSISGLKVNVAWGTDDWYPIQQAINLANETGVSVYLPPGHYLITRTLTYLNFEPARESQEDSYPLMRPGLKLLGAGVQKTFIHNQGRGNPTIQVNASDFTPNIKYFSFQQTGILRDFNITSTGHVDGTTGIDLRETWGYTIQNVHVRQMGSDGIILRNTLTPAGMFPRPNSDGDANDKVCIDNALIYKNGGWGIIVDADDTCLSTSRMEIKRCKIEENKHGGIQWAGQTGLVEYCGIYGNGVEPGKKTPFMAPKAVPGAYGLLVKNVNATSNGLWIRGCEIQGNADVQIMLSVGANIKITQNDFKSDDITLNWCFPRTDIQVGDGNLNREILNSVIEDNRARGSFGELGGWGNPASGNPDTTIRPHTVVMVTKNAIGTVIARWWTQFTEKGNWKLVEFDDSDPSGGRAKALRLGLAHVKTHVHRGDAGGGHALLPFASKLINLDNTSPPPPKSKEDTEFYRLKSAGLIIGDFGDSNITFIPDNSHWASYHFRITGTIATLNIDNPRVRVIGSPLFLSFRNVRSDKKDVTVNFGILESGKKVSDFDAGEGLKLSYGEFISGILLFDEDYKWRLYAPWNCRGVPLRVPLGTESPKSMVF